MRVLICGGRDYNDWEEFRDTLEEIAWDRFPRSEPDELGNFLYSVTIIHGGAKGADSLADQWAVVNWSKLKVFPANWKKHKKAAGPIRNQLMLDEGQPELVIAFPGGNGTADMIKRAQKAGIEVIQPLAHTPRR